MAQQQGGASTEESEPDPALARERAARLASQRAAADAAIAAVTGGRQTLAAMTSAAAAAARSAETVETKRTADLAAVAAQENGLDEATAAATQGPDIEGGEDADVSRSAPEAVEAAEFDESDESDESESEPAAAPGAAAAALDEADPGPVPEPEPAAEQAAARRQPVRRPSPARPRALGPAQPPHPAIARWIAAEGAPASFVDALRAGFGEGEDAAQRLTEDPWLILDLPGVQPAAADNLAALLLGAASREQVQADPRRSRALVTALLRRAARLGHTAVAAEAAARDLGGLGVPDPAGAIADAVEHGAALVFADRLALAAAAQQRQKDAGPDEAEFEAVDDADDDDPETMLTSPYTLLALDEWAFAEQSAAEAAQRLLATATPIAPRPAGGPDGADAAEAERVRRVVEEAAGTGLILVTGGSPTLPGLVAAGFDGALLAGPSPAGLRLLAAAGFPALDLRALSEDPAAVEEARVLVVADAQLVPLELGVELLELLPDGAHLVLCGDAASLPATGPGRLFRDLLEIDDPGFGGSVPRVELKRRPSGPLSALVDAVRHGGLPPMEILSDGQSNEVKIIPVRDPAETRLRTVQLVTDSIPRALGFEGAQVQAIAVREQGPAGAEELNAAIKERLNPGPGVCAGFDAGDRVVVREGGRLAEYGLRGGETGTVLAADAAGLTVRLDPPVLALPPAEEPAGGLGSAGPESWALGADEPEPGGSGTAQQPGETFTLDARRARALRHAWVLTLREAQGGQWPAVVAVLDGGSAAALTRSAVLGAFTTAGRHLSVVHGAGGALAEAVEARPHTPCRTRLAQALRG